MKSSLPISFFVLFAALTYGVSGTHAQPKGWPCDLAIRPGNSWHYRSTVPGFEFYRDSIDRDSIGADGSYWAHVFGTQNWYRFDTSCTLYRYANPSQQFKYDWLWLKPLADTSEWWVVCDTSGSRPFTTAEVYAVRSAVVLGRTRRIQEVVYYEGEVAERWWLAVDYAEGIGEIYSRDHHNTNVLVGAVIDGVRYGRINPSGVDDEESPRTFSVPASSGPRLSMEITP